MLTQSPETKAQYHSHFNTLDTFSINSAKYFPTLNAKVQIQTHVAANRYFLPNSLEQAPSFALHNSHLLLQAGGLYTRLLLDTKYYPLQKKKKKSLNSSLLDCSFSSTLSFFFLFFKSLMSLDGEEEKWWSNNAQVLPT